MGFIDRFQETKLYRAFRSRFKRGFFGRLVIYLVLGLISYEFLYPIFRMVSMTFMNRADIIDPAVTWIPTVISLKNLKIASDVLNLPRSMFNSIWFSSLLAIFQSVTAALTGYALSRFDFKFKRFWVVMIIIAFILPLPLLVISRNMIFVTLQEMTAIKLIGTPIPQSLLALFGQGVYSTILILIFYNFMQMIPRSLDEAAEIDGAGKFQVFYHIGIRISISTFLVVFLLSVVWNWNESFMTATFLRGSIELLPGNLGLFDNLFGSRAPSDMIPNVGMVSMLNEALKMAATLLSMLPLIILYFFVQKRFIKGIENTGITGE